MTNLLDYGAEVDRPNVNYYQSPRSWSRCGPMINYDSSPRSQSGNVPGPTKQMTDLIDHEAVLTYQMTMSYD